MSRRRRKRNPAGSDVLPWIIGGAVVVVAGVVVVNQMRTANTNAVASGTPQPYPAVGDSTVPIINAVGQWSGNLIKDVTGGGSSGGGSGGDPAAGTVYVTLSNGDVVYNDGNGGFVDGNGNPLTADQVANAQLMG